MEDAEITASVLRASVYVVNKTARLRLSFIHTEARRICKIHI